VLIIDEGSGDKPYPGPHIVEKNLTGLIAVLKLSDTYFIKYLGISTCLSQQYSARQAQNRHIPNRQHDSR
jgi:hypothetical protein